MGSAAPLTILICTYNREELLRDCLNSLFIQDAIQDEWEILIVNNYHQDFSNNTQDLIASTPNARYIREFEPGLSQARNTGVSNISSDWIAFLDDDAIVPQDYIYKIFQLATTGSFDCFGGGIQSWWRYGRPRWLDKDYGSKPPLRSERGLISEGYNWGSNIIINRNALIKVGLFPSAIGMKGQKIGYAAENIVQDKLRQHGYQVGYDPELEIKHVVAQHKLKLSWHIQSAYATGRDGWHVFHEQYGWMGMLKSCKSCFSRPLKSVLRFLMQRNHSWERVYLDLLLPWALFFGKIRAQFNI